MNIMAEKRSTEHLANSIATLKSALDYLQKVPGCN